MIQVIWFKRDLRWEDHAPLAMIDPNVPTLLLYVFEPEYWQLPDTSERQWQFTRECLIDLNRECNQRWQTPLTVYSGDILDALNTIQSKYGAFQLFSHEETGNLWTYQRDKTVKSWIRNNACHWHEYPQFGVRRPNPNRDDWAQYWQSWMKQTCYSSPIQLNGIYANNNTQINISYPSEIKRNHPETFTFININDLPLTAGFNQVPCPGRQHGGRTAALDIFNSFFNERGHKYRGSISSPLTAEHYCSRLSTYIAYGCISMREIIQRVWKTKSFAEGRWKQSLAGFESRLWWHCHFIQKLEDEPGMQVNCLHSAYANMRTETDSARLDAWYTGNTGWPMVDACMRYLHHTGWLNFRMRAMLVSIASYPLWLPWQATAPLLAGLFTDYEPGIHYPQVQMQAGTTGINIPRMYNPTKQAEEQDPHGEFIRRWIPELSHVSNHWIHQPWKMGTAQQRQAQIKIGHHYPAPIVDFDSATRQAKHEIKVIRDASFFQQSKTIGNKHGSRKRSSTTSMKRRPKKDNSQLSLFD